MREPADKSRLLNFKGVAERLCMSPSYVRGQRSLRMKGKPHFFDVDAVKIGGKSVRYWEADVDAFVAKLKAANDNDAADESDQAPEPDDSVWTVFVDGSCIDNPGPGGYAFRAVRGDVVIEFADGEPETTNNRMEMTAAIVALQRLPVGSKITLYSDSKLVIDGITDWIHKWKANDWKSSGRKPVANQDLWERLDEARQKHEVDWQWIRGHAGVPGHDRADALARRAAERQARNAGPASQRLVR